MKKSKLILSVATMCLAIAVLCFGVYAVQTVNYTLGGNISYEVTDAFVEITSKLYRYNQCGIMDGGEAFEIMDSMVPMSFAEIDSMPNSKLSLVEELGTYSSANNAGSPNVDGMNLVYGKEANQAYAYFIVVNIKNIGDMPVYAITGELVNPPQSWQTNSSGIVNLQNGQAKNVIFAFGLNNPYTSIPADTAISYQVKVGPFEGTKELTYQDTTGGVEITGIEDTFTGDVVVIPNQIDGKDVVSVNGYCVTESVKGMVFGDNVKSITGCADNPTDFLSAVVFSDTNNITEITNSFGDNRLWAITIPKSLQTIKTNFLYYNEISVLYIPASVTLVEEGAWTDINETTGGLQYVRVASDNENYSTMYNGEQINCVVQNLDNTLICGSRHAKLIPDGVTSIVDWAFFGCSNLTSITIPSSVTNMGNSTFGECVRLSEVIIENGVTSIGSEAFCGCTSLSEITIPSSVTSIGSSAFKYCSGLERIKVDAGNTVYTSRDKSGVEINCLIETSTNKLISGCKYSTIPTDGSVISIGDSAFYGCTGLTEITIPSNITSIGDGVFYGCTGLTDITVADNFPTSIRRVFNLSGATVTITPYVTEIYRDKFEGCTNLTKVIVQDGIKRIGSSAFDGCTGLTSIEIPSSVTSIGSGAFFHCTGLTSIEIPSSVTSIEGNAFAGCTGLTSITIPNSVTSISESAFGDCTGLLYTDTVNKLKYIKTTDNNYFALYSTADTNITSCTINNNCKLILQNAFSGCASLASITIPNSVTTIGFKAFSGCTSLTSITIPSSVTNMGHYVFENCTGLTQIVNNSASITERALPSISGKSWYKDDVVITQINGIGTYICK